MTPVIDGFPGRARARPLVLVLVLMSAVVALSGCDQSGGSDLDKVNGSVHVPAGQPAAAAATVNGSIHIDPQAAVTSAKAVNGAIQLGDHATATGLNTVNGSITIDPNAHVSGDTISVNGSFSLRPGAEVSGGVRNVNGAISLSGAHVGGGIETVNGSISIYGPSHVEGGILVKKPGGFLSFGNTVPRVEIGPGAVVSGDLRFEREVKLFVSDRATVGAITGATPTTFTGDTAPAG